MNESTGRSAELSCFHRFRRCGQNPQGSWLFWNYADSRNPPSWAWEGLRTVSRGIRAALGTRIMPSVGFLGACQLGASLQAGVCFPLVLLPANGSFVKSAVQSFLSNVKLLAYKSLIHFGI